jgi:hypothetical protein
MAGGVAHKGGKKNRKYGRNKVGCKAYLVAGTEEKNRKRRMRTTLRHQPNNMVLLAHYELQYGVYQQ